MKIIDIAQKAGSSMLTTACEIVFKPFVDYHMNENERAHKLMTEPLPPCCKNPMPHGPLSCWNRY